MIQITYMHNKQTNKLHWCNAVQLVWRILAKVIPAIVCSHACADCVVSIWFPINYIPRWRWRHVVTKWLVLLNGNELMRSHDSTPYRTLKSDHTIMYKQNINPEQRENPGVKKGLILAKSHERTDIQWMPLTPLIPRPNNVDYQSKMAPRERDCVFSPLPRTSLAGWVRGRGEGNFPITNSPHAFLFVAIDEKGFFLPMLGSSEIVQFQHCANWGDV